MLWCVKTRRTSPCCRQFKTHKWYLEIEQTGKRKHYYNMFLHLLDQTLWNSFGLYGKQGGLKTPLQFRLNLVQKITEKWGKSQQTSGRPSESSSPVLLIGRRFIEVILSTSNKDRYTRQCKVCSRKNASGKKIRNETR